MATEPPPQLPNSNNVGPNTGPKTGPRKSPPWLWIGLGVVVLLAGGLALLSSGDDQTLSVGSTVAPGDTAASGTTAAPGSTEVAPTTPGPPTTVMVSKGEVWPVTVTGTPLDPLPQHGADPAVGQMAPQLSGFTFDGSTVAIDPSKGPVMLVFLAHWCPHCNREVPEFMKWKASGDVPANLQVIAVTTAVNPNRDFYPPSKWIVDKGWTWPVMADSETSDAAQAMGVSSFPFSVMIGEDGTVLGRVTGELGQDGIAAWVNDTLA
jgi:cytochrome c biogenesis protein CcmG, thiol:disulfide interchange protein DsbE